MPNESEPRRRWTAEGLKKRVTGCTKKIGDAVRNQDDGAANILRERRQSAMRKLAERFDVWTLVNPEGKTEFVDRAEWEQRMIAWGRRNGAVPRARVNLNRRTPTPPAAATGTDTAAPPPPPPTQEDGPTPSPGQIGI